MRPEAIRYQLIQDKAAAMMDDTTYALFRQYFPEGMFMVVPYTYEKGAIVFPVGRTERAVYINVNPHPVVENHGAKATFLHLGDALGYVRYDLFGDVKHSVQPDPYASLSRPRTKLMQYDEYERMRDRADGFVKASAELERLRGELTKVRIELERARMQLCEIRGDAFGAHRYYVRIAAMEGGQG